jgi:hypothetical protein
MHQQSSIKDLGELRWSTYSYVHTHVYSLALLQVANIRTSKALFCYVHKIIKALFSF